MNHRVAFLFVLTFLLASCTAGSTTPSLQPTATSIPAPTDTLVPTPALPPTETLAPIGTAPPVDPVCAPPRSHDPLADAAFTEYPLRILSFLNAGATPQELDRALYDQGVANQPVGVLSADMTGDGKLDVVVSLFDPESQHIPPAGALLIYTCQGDSYGLVVYQPTGAQAGGPRLYALQDLNADGAADLVDSVATCGASTCFEAVRVWAWDGVGLVNQLIGDTLDLPFPLVEVKDIGGSRYAVEVTGTTPGSVGAGPTRPTTRVFAFDAAQPGWRAVDERLGESNFRIHKLHDAEAAALNGAYIDALLLYQRVVSDDSLQDWSNPTAERANLAAYARYKMVVIYTLQAQPDFARLVLDELKAAEPENGPRYAYVEMALAFQRGFEQGGVAAGCQAARRIAADQSAVVLDPLGPGVFGYANPDLTPADMCPW